jgi:hypothetical protein
MKYGDELDRIPTTDLSRRQFLTAGGHRAAQLAAGVLLPGSGRRVIDASTDAVTTEQSDEQPDRREG